jgi:response regulator RpfG family c-di-GMP phosphodiesterase
MNSTNKILVVDDEAVIRELLTDILEDDGYPVESMPNAPSALELLRRRDDFVLLFTDIMMPDMDGIQLIREARKIRPTLIPIVMTGFATIETARAAVKEGAYDYVLKPFSLSEVKLAVGNAIERYRLSNENARLRELTEIFEISESMASIQEESKLLDFVLQAALNQVGAYRGSLMLAGQDGKTLEVAASAGLSEEAVSTIVEFGKGISGKVAESGQPILVENMADHPQVEKVSRRLAETSFVSLPLKSPSASEDTGTSPKVLAVLNVCGKNGNGPFTDADLKTLDIVANHAAAALGNVRKLRKVERDHLASLEQMAQLLESRDGYLDGHNARVRDIAVKLAQVLDLSSSDCEQLGLVAMLHDIGYLGIDSALLRKTGELTEVERNQIREHTVIGYDIVKSADMLSPEHRQVVLHHHERVDGSGYPDGLSGDEIPLVVRILAVAEAVVAMASERPYRKALALDEIVDELRSTSGGQFDPTVAEKMIALIQGGTLI